MQLAAELKMAAYIQQVLRRSNRPRPQLADPNSIESQADLALVLWAPWVRDQTNLGLPRISVTETANTGGVMRGGVRPGSDMPDEVALTDRAVAKLGSRHRSILRRVVFLRYEKGLPIEAISREIGQSVSRVRSTLGRAQRAVWRYRAP